MEGNDIADRLAKDAVVEAKEMDEDIILITVQYIKMHARTYIKRKWRQRWSVGELAEISTYVNRS